MRLEDCCSVTKPMPMDVRVYQTEWSGRTWDYSHGGAPTQCKEMFHSEEEEEEFVVNGDRRGKDHSLSRGAGAGG